MELEHHLFELDDTYLFCDLRPGPPFSRKTISHHARAVSELASFQERRQALVHQCVIELIEVGKDPGAAPNRTAKAVHEEMVASWDGVMDQHSFFSGEVVMNPSDFEVVHRPLSWLCAYLSHTNRLVTRGE